MIVWVPSPFRVAVQVAGVPGSPWFPFDTVADVPSEQVMVAVPLPLFWTEQDLPSFPLSPEQPAIARVPARSSAAARFS